MKQDPLKNNNKGIETFSTGANLSWLPYAVFFAISFIFYSFLADYTFFYQEKDSLFVFTSDMMKDSLGKAGGLLVYISSFLTSFYYFPVAGALILSGIITSITVITGRIIFLLSAKRNIVIPFTIGLLLFLLQTDYRFMLYNLVGFLVLLTIFLPAVKHRNILNGWLPVFIMPLMYILTGGFFWIFFLSVSLFLIFSKTEKRFIKLMSILVLAGLTIYISKEYLFFVSGKDTYLYPFPELNKSYQGILFGSVSVLMILLPAIAGITFPSFRRINLGKATENLLATGLVAAALIFFSVKMYDRKIQQYFHAEKLFSDGRYEELNEYNRKHPSTNSLTIFLNNAALCELGKLDDQLFYSLQSPDGRTLFLKWEMMGEILKRGGYFYYAAGMINEAHRWAFENMVMKGLSHEDLRMLVKTELINGNYSMASKYISILGKTVFYRKDAKHFRKFLNNDDAVNADKELGYKRINKVKKDFFSITDEPSVNLEMMLAGGSVNKEALEYFCANLLLKKDYKGIMKILPEFAKEGYTRLPVNIEEAVEAISLMNNGQLPYTGNIPVSRETETRWNQYLTIFGQYNTDLKAAEPALRKQFGNTFWYYAFYR